MTLRDVDDIGYRSQITARRKPEPASQNEQEFSTLKVVRTALADGVDSLSKDFNAFTILTDKDQETAAKNLLMQVAAKQIAYDILNPLLTAVDEAMRLVNDKYKEN